MTVKSLTFYSNYFNHHQKALCDEWYKLLGDGFTFVETMPMEEFRRGMGWGENRPSYVLASYENETNEKKAIRLAMGSDLVVFGTAPEYYIKERLNENKIIFRYSERPLKEGFIKFFIPRLTKKYLNMHVKNRKKNIHILGASAFTSLDYKKMFNSYPNKCYKFGYFPKHMEYDVEELMRLKDANNEKSHAVNILWEGRMLKLKRPDLLIEALKNVRDEGFDCCLTMVGEGEVKDKLVKMTRDYNLTDIVTFEDFLSPDEAREKMAGADIYVMTSNFWEGWGSVIYEALNAGCAVISSHACGATPWLIRHNETGLVFKSEDVESLTNALRQFLSSYELRRKMGRAAYNQMHTLWNPEVAAKRTIKLCEALEEGLECPFDDGPLSRAEFLENNWFKDYGK